MPLSVALLQGIPIRSAMYSLANWAFTTAVAVALLGLAQVLRSAPVWLVRPPAYLERWGFPGDAALFLLVLTAHGVVALLALLAVARRLTGTLMSQWLFGCQAATFSS